MKKVVLAYSGGLDTSVILHYLAYEKGFEVIALCVDLGQEENFNALKKKALLSGASKFYLVDKKEELLKISLKAVKSHAVYEKSYLLGTALARFPIAEAQINIAKKENSGFVAHGATGKGNDQIRLELAYNFLDPSIKVISPWKDKDFLSLFKGRSSLKKYAEKNSIPIDTTYKKHSVDENILHISYEGGFLEDASNSSESFFCSKQKEKKKVGINFTKNNVELSIDDKKYKGLNALSKIKHLSLDYCFGVEDVIENRYLGIKSRAVYFQGVLYLLSKSYNYLESAILNKHLYHKKLENSHELGKMIYEGKWFSPYVQSLIKFSEDNSVEGRVNLIISPYNVFPVSLSKENSSILKEGSFETNSGVENSKGFIEIIKKGGG